MDYKTQETGKNTFLAFVISQMLVHIYLYLLMLPTFSISPLSLSDSPLFKGWLTNIIIPAKEFQELFDTWSPVSNLIVNTQVQCLVFLMTA